MKISICVEADYDDLEDRHALKREELEKSLGLIARRIEVDYRNKKSEHEKYGTFFQVYTVAAGSRPKRLRADDTANEILKQAQLFHPSTSERNTDV